MTSRRSGRWKMTGKQTFWACHLMIQSISQRGTQTQNRPHSSVVVVAMTSRRHENGKNQDQGELLGK